ncbi:hypothetical protein HZB93_01455 [Candidatus Falkowbacteria bacterium]|nr:hypothetical protein [Candidatus Falkowbacteria bacterium]
MSKKLLFALLAGALVLAGAGCGEKKETPAAENENKNVNQVITANVNGSVVELVEPSGEEEVVGEKEAGGVEFVEYVNKSVGYKIVRPDGWYWQHFIEREISEAMPGVFDLFVTDPNPLPGFGTGYLGRIVIEVSERSMDELARNVSDLTSSAVTVGGISATKYEGVRTNEMVENQKVIAYHFQKDGKTYRIVYTKINSTSEEEAVFQRVVDSLTF